ncbi:MAG: site-2 protease family protein [Gemmatimonadetes bacterium]|nr:site-2 protease family protein [Gemmatimonadota bacterium]
MSVERLVLILPVLLFSVVAHEYAHARVAVAEGDPTPAMLGRLTLNPLPHIDLIGSVAVPLLLIVLNTGFLFGWAKPVPTVPRNYRNFRRGDILVSGAGVAMNFALAIAFTLLAGVVGAIGGDPGAAPLLEGLRLMAAFGILINLILGVFNLLPIPPLDGSHLFYHLLPATWGARYRALGHQYGLLLVALVIMIPGVGRLLLAPAFWLFGLAAQVAGL